MSKGSHTLVWMSILIAVCSAAAICLSYRWSKSEVDIVSEPKRYHLVALYSGDNQNFVSELERGMDLAADELNIWITFKHFSSTAPASHLQAFARAIDSKADGIITNIPDHNQIGKLIDRAALQHIPVATIVDDIYGSQRRVHIGVDYRRFGEEAAKTICAMMPEGARTAIISYPINKQTNECLNKIKGFSHYIQSGKGYCTGIENVRELNSADAYELTEELLNSRFHYDSFFCLDETITKAVAQCLNEAGRTDICVVGCGESQTVHDYLNIGVVDALLTENAYTVGSTSVEELVRYMENGGLPYVVEAEMRILTYDNAGCDGEESVA